MTVLHSDAQVRLKEKKKNGQASIRTMTERASGAPSGHSGVPVTGSQPSHEPFLLLLRFLHQPRLFRPKRVLPIKRKATLSLSHLIKSKGVASRPRQECFVCYEEIWQEWIYHGLFFFFDIKNVLLMWAALFNPLPANSLLHDQSKGLKQ